MDDGQGFCKVGALFLDRAKEDTAVARSKYSEVKISEMIFYWNLIATKSQGVAPKSFKCSSVKKLLVLGIVPEVPENHPNMETLLGELNMEAVEFSVSADVKMRQYFIEDF